MVQLNGNIIENCNRCEESYYAYGFCLNTMDNGILQNEIIICAETFIFDGQECACPNGTTLNNTICVNIFENMSKIIVTLEDYKLKIEQSIISNMTQVTVNLNQLQIDIDSRIISDIATLDAKIQNTLDSLNTSIYSINSSLKQQAATNDQINETVQLLKQEILVLVAQINCESKQGYSYVDNLCVQVPCDIAGQLNINGICQCIGMFQIVKNNLCVCPDNSVFSNGVCTCTILGQVMKNGVCKCHTSGAFVLNSVCSCGENSVNTSNTCGCPVNSVLIDSACICTSIYGQIMKEGTCICQLNQMLVNGVCTYKINNDDALMVCTAQLLIATFNINAITNSVTSSSDFGAGYVFSQTVVYQNIFIDVQNNVYSTTIKPLFQNQIQFTNIKIQFGTQVMGGGAVLSSLSTIRVNNMNIISKSGCTITVQTNYQLNLLVGTYKDNNIIDNLLINLSMLMSSGNLTLIGNINSILLIQNYSILGNYQNSLQMSLVALITNTSTLTITNLTFAPSSFQAGNYSSYFMSFVNASTVHMDNISVILGSYGNKQISNSISSTYSYSYQFGGFMNSVQSSTFKLIKCIQDVYQTYNTPYARNTGVLIGFCMTANSQILIQNMCFQQLISGSTLYFEFCGLFGQNVGNVSLQQSNIAFTIQTVALNFFGIIGLYEDSATYSEIINIRTTFNTIVNSESTGRVSAIVGWQKGKQLVIQNTTVQNSNISSQSYVGSIAGAVWYLFKAVNVTIQNSNISGYDNSTAGFVGWGEDAQIYITNSSISNVRIRSSSYFGIVFGRNYDNTYIYLTTSWSVGNYINDVLQPNCASLTNGFADAGC
ncbi:Conserved_hypothetical protein [Hexamita inflata]|uniref:Uncharacterized protein n=1 Tax=Hexamita inflata TaxID=28002 RepID=A0AA86V5R3_9EUKA|nr:Conserved hypothetical protein [Hexamita inflata]